MFGIKFSAPDGTVGYIDSLSSASGRPLVRIDDRWFDASEVWASR